MKIQFNEDYTYPISNVSQNYFSQWDNNAFSSQRLDIQIIGQQFETIRHELISLSEEDLDTIILLDDNDNVITTFNHYTMIETLNEQYSQQNGEYVQRVMRVSLRQQDT